MRGTLFGPVRRAAAGACEVDLEIDTAARSRATLCSLLYANNSASISFMYRFA